MSAITVEPVAEAQDATPEPERRGGTPTRNYVVLEQIELEADGVAFVEAHKVEARNGDNALRRAFRELRAERPELDETTLVVIPEGQWKPRPVRAERSEQIKVAIGA